MEVAHTLGEGLAVFFGGEMSMAFSNRVVLFTGEQWGRGDSVRAPGSLSDAHSWQHAQKICLQPWTVTRHMRLRTDG